MTKRIAYIGLSYPLLYDYKNMAPFTQNDIYDSPNPIIDSPLGLMILYDELWFLCESLCPSNMRNLPYVKFVDKMFQDLYYEGADLFIECTDLKIDSSIGLSYDDILNRLKLDRQFGADTHTHSLKIGNIMRSASNREDNFAFDIYILMSLQERCADSIELVSNSRYPINEFTNSFNEAKTVEKIVIPNIPNYLNKEGPYHPCMEELRENRYLIDFRKWIVRNHNSIQYSEVNEICEVVDRSIKETNDRLFKKYLDDSSKYSFFASTGKTIIKTAAGIISTQCSILDALLGITINGKNTFKANCDRWQGFVVDSRNIVDSNKLNLHNSKF